MSYARSMEVTKEGNDIYWGGYPNHCVYKYHSDNGTLGPYALQDTVLKGFDAESFCWNPKTGHLWASAGSYNDLPNRYPELTTSFTPGSWYAYDTMTGTIKDSLLWQFTFPENVWERPRAIAFSPGGDTAYVGVYGSGQIISVRMYCNPSVAFVSLESPNGEETWLAGSTHSIRWTSNLVANVAIEYSVNNGASWTTITPSSPAAVGSYSWIVPAVPSTECLVRVTDAAQGSRTDASDEPFTISMTGPPQEVEPNNTASQAHMLAYGDSIDAIIDPPTDVDYFSFTASAGDTVELFAANTDSPVDIQLWLYNRNGELVANNDDYITNMQCRLVYVVGLGGTYYVRCAYYNRPGEFPNRAGTGSGDEVLARSVDRLQSPAAGIWSYRLWVRRFSPSAPIVDPHGITTVCATQALLMVRFFPNGLPTVVSAEFGTTTAYGSTVVAAGSPVNGLWEEGAQLVLSPLSPGTVYHCRVVGENALGAVYSDDMTFETPPASSQWSVANIGNGFGLLSVDYADPLHGRAVGWDRNSMLTTDGGTTWQFASAEGIVPGWHFESVAMHTATSATVVGYTILRVTNSYNWTEQSNPSSQYLRSVAFSTPQSGFAVGNMGAIVHTADAGNLWSAQTSGTSAQLRGVACVGDQMAWAVGGSGAIVHTTDGGASWASQASGTTVQLNSVRFINSTTGVVVGNSGTIVRTTDGGATWSPQSSGTTVQLNSVCFTDGNRGLAVGNAGTVLRTTDGGFTWTQEASGTTATLLSVDVLEGNYATIVGAAGIILNSSGSVALLIPNGSEVWNAGSSRTIHWVSRGVTNVGLDYSTDGGATWATIVASTPAADQAYIWTVPGSVSAVCKVRIRDASDAALFDVSNETFAIVAAAATSESEPNNTAPQANFFSYGDSLDASIAPAGDVDYYMFTGVAGDTVDIYAANRNEGNVDGQIWLYDANGDELATQHNYGNTNAEHRIVHILPATGLYYVRFSFYQTAGAFPNSSRDGEPGPIEQHQVSVPGGGAFMSATSPTDPVGEGEYRIRLRRFAPGPPAAISSLGAVGMWWDACRLTGRVDPNGLLTTVTFEYGLTTGYGNSTGIPTSTIDGLSIQDVVSVEAGGLSPATTYHCRMVASNSEGTTTSEDFTFATADGPPTAWERKDDGSHQLLYSVSFSSYGHGIAVGIGGVGLITTDYGLHWTTGGALGGSDIYSVATPSAGLAYAVGAGGAILKTSNGGTTWDFQPSGTGAPLFSVSFTQNSVGTAVGDYGTIVRTTDGGLTWVQQSSGVGDLLRGVHFSNTDCGTAVGRNGRILRTTDGGASWTVQTSGTANFLRAVSFLDANTGMCVGANGTILKTTDGGTTWTPLSGGTTVRLSAVCLTSTSHAWIAGDGGTILSTEDGGTTWSAEQSGTTSGLFGMSFPMHGQGTIVGNWGAIIRRVSNTPVWSGEITVNDAGPGSGTIVCGQAGSATDGIDASLGEAELPPVPPVGTFDARFIIPAGPGVGSLKDYRKDTCTAATWRFAFQPGSAGYPMTVTWDASGLPAGSFFLKDEFGGAVVNVNMKMQNSCTVVNTGVVALRIEYTATITTSVTVLEGWNMVSIPVVAPDMSPGALFPDATSTAFGYSGGYAPAAVLVPGRGYWLKFGDAHTIALSGLEQGTRDVIVGTGWNLIGTFEFDAPVASITSTPADIVTSTYYAFTSGYTASSVLSPGKAYWVKTSGSGTLHMPAGILKIAEDPVKAPSWVCLEFEDSRGMRRAVYLAPPGEVRPGVELPPLPPQGIFDVRFGSNASAECIGQVRHEILLHSAEYPVTLLAKNLGGAGLVVQDAVDGSLVREALCEGKAVTLTRPLDRLLLLETNPGSELPTEFALHQNYPNPFNPGTTIRFDLPQCCHVVISVYNTLGQAVRELVGGDLEAGYHSVDFDAAGLASGVYFYRIQVRPADSPVGGAAGTGVGGFTALKKLIVLR